MAARAFRDLQNRVGKVLTASREQTEGQNHIDSERVYFRDLTDMGVKTDAQLASLGRTAFNGKLFVSSNVRVDILAAYREAHPNAHVIENYGFPRFGR